MDNINLFSLVDQFSSDEQCLRALDGFSWHRLSTNLFHHSFTGNHDKVCSGIEAGEMFNKIALQSARWTEEKLLPRHRKVRLARIAAQGTGSGQRNPVPLSWDATRRGRLYFRRDRSSKHVPALRYSALLLRPQPLPPPFCSGSTKTRSRPTSPSPAAIPFASSCSQPPAT